MKKIIKLIAVGVLCLFSFGSTAVNAKADGWLDEPNQVWHEGYWTPAWFNEQTQTWVQGTFVETGAYPLNGGAAGTAATVQAAAPAYTGYSYTVPYYKQRGAWYSSYQYGDGTLGDTGCGVCTLAMILSAIQGYAIDPSQVASVLYAAGSYNHPELGYGMGTLGQARFDAANAYGVACEAVYDYNTFLYDLQQGMLISEMAGPGTIYGSSHGIVVAGYNSRNNKVRVYDPLGGCNGWYNAEKVFNWHSTDWADLDAGTTVFAFHSY